jgi:hypothetical protein
LGCTVFGSNLKPSKAAMVRAIAFLHRMSPKNFVILKVAWSSSVEGKS